MIIGALILLLLFLSGFFALTCTILYYFLKRKRWAVAAIVSSLMNIYNICIEKYGFGVKNKFIYLNLLNYVGMICLVTVPVLIYRRRGKEE